MTIQIVKTLPENQTISRLFYWLAALQILIIIGGAVVGLFMAPLSIFVSKTEAEYFGWLAIGLIGILNIALGVILIPLSLVAASAFRNDKKWRKVVGIAASVLAVLEIPFGTILGGYLVWKIINRKKN